MDFELNQVHAEKFSVSIRSLDKYRTEKVPPLTFITIVLCFMRVVLYFICVFLFALVLQFKFVFVYNDVNYSKWQSIKKKVRVVLDS